MLSRRMVLVAALGVMLGAFPSHRLAAQTVPAWNARPSLEGGYTQIRFAGDGRTLNADGVGAKLLWNAVPVAGSTSLVDRTGLGLYATYTPEHSYGPSLSFSSVGVGAVADVRPFEAPIAGRVDPFVSVGAGLLRTNVARSAAPAPSPLVTSSGTSFALTPGLGARVLLTRNVALQGDVRDLMTFRDDTRHNVAFGTGLRLTF